jgi:spore maturation protein CgeB
MILFNKLISKSLREIGFDVYDFDWNSIYKFNKSIKIFSGEKVRKKINQGLLKKAISIKPDFVFVLKGEPIFTETLDEIKKESNATLFNWFGDDPWEFPLFSSRVANHYDYFFTYDPYSVKLYNEIGQTKAFHLPYGYDERIAEEVILTPKDYRKYSCDIAFIGSHYYKREELLSKIKDNYDLKIWGRGWNNTSCSGAFMGAALYGLEMLKAMKCAKIILNIHKGFEEGIEVSGEGLNLRVMETIACGGFQITNLQNDIPNRFVLDKEIVTFKTWDEAVDKIDYYLLNDEKRNEIAAKGLLRLKADHTLNTRLKEMFGIINA